MDNTARKLEAESLINEVKSTHGSLDLLKVFLITGATDISKSYELINGWYKHAKSEADKANFENALKTLQEIELKRIELTSLIYNISPTLNVDAEIVKEETEDNNVILMLPKLDDVLDRVRNILKNGKEDIGKATVDAYAELKSTVGEGKAMTAERKSITWNDETIHAFIDSFVDNNGLNKQENVTEESKKGESFGFQTIYEHFTELIKNNKSEEEIKSSLKDLLLSKTITENGGSTYLIKDEAVFEDYYTRILANLIKVGIESYTKSTTPIVDKIENAEKVVEEEIKPFLEELDKDETVSSFVAPAKKLKQIYSSLGLKSDLRDLLFKAKELGEKYAPNLFKRNQKQNSSSTPIVEPVQTVSEAPKEEIQIYDESHNIMESNKPLWEEVKDYQYLDEVFTKAEELEKKGNWRDALSMTTILISSGKIKETEKSEETLKWDAEQIRDWYESLFSPFNKYDEPSPTTEASTIEATGEVTPTAETTPIQQIAVVAGTLDSGSAKEQIVRMLKQSADYKDKYQFAVYEAPTDSHNKSSMAFQVIDDVDNKEGDLLITKTNMIKMMDEMRDRLVVQRNLQPEIKKEIQEKLSLYYDISNSEAKRIVGGLINQADAIRRETKRAKREAKKVQENTNVENPQSESAESNVEQKVIEDSTSQDNTNPTENTAGETSTNSNNEKSKVGYTGFEDIIKAKDKYNTHVAIYNKVKSFETAEEGIKAVFEVINVARKDRGYKRSFIRNWKPTPAADLLNTIRKIVERGEEVSKSTVE